MYILAKFKQQPSFCISQWLFGRCVGKLNAGFQLVECIVIYEHLLPHKDKPGLQVISTSQEGNPLYSEGIFHLKLDRIHISREVTENEIVFKNCKEAYRLYEQTKSATRLQNAGLIAPNNKPLNLNN